MADMSQTNALLEVLISEVQGMRDDFSKISLGDINIEDIWIRLGDLENSISDQAQAVIMSLNKIEGSLEERG